MKRARYFETTPKGNIRCTLCPHRCTLGKGSVGLCLSRKNIDGTLYAINYGQVCSLHVDPIEKKPLYHFHPGSSILSLGNNGCNLRCAFCQNWEISQQRIPTRYVSPEEALDLVSRESISAVAFTYAEPMIWFEYILDTARLLKSSGIHTVLVTNGMINREPLEELLPHIDAMNIDIKSMREAFYRNICNGQLKAVLETAELSAARCHVEITNLVIPGENDTEEEFHELARFIAEHLGKKTVLHLSRYHPAYKFHRPPTSEHTLETARNIALQYLDFVYIGNVWNDTYNSTHCPRCGKMLIRRSGFQVLKIMLENGACPECGYDTEIIT